MFILVFLFIYFLYLLFKILTLFFNINLHINWFYLKYYVSFLVLFFFTFFIYFSTQYIISVESDLYFFLNEDTNGQALCSDNGTYFSDLKLLILKYKYYILCIFSFSVIFFLLYGFGGDSGGNSGGIPFIYESSESSDSFINTVVDSNDFNTVGALRDRLDILSPMTVDTITESLPDNLNYMDAYLNKSFNYDESSESIDYFDMEAMELCLNMSDEDLLEVITKAKIYGKLFG